MAIVQTTLDLYRAGDANGPKFDHFRAGEIVVQVRNGVDWVLGPNQGGASTKAAPGGLKRVTWYLLPRGTPYDDATFLLWNDYADHWSWEPARDMQLADYLAALKALVASFRVFQQVP
jgi:hypothetical protein